MSFVPQSVGGAATATARRGGGVLFRLALRRREWVALFQGHEIRVITRGPLPARLLVDGRRRDRRSPLLITDRRIPLLSAMLPGGAPMPRVVEVFVNGPLGRRIAVRVGGVQVRAVRADRER